MKLTSEQIAAFRRAGLRLLSPAVFSEEEVSLPAQRSGRHSRQPPPGGLAREDRARRAPAFAGPHL